MDTTFYRYKNQRHTCHLTTNCYKSMAVRTVLAFLRQKNDQQQYTIHSWRVTGEHQITSLYVIIVCLQLQSTKFNEIHFTCRRSWGKQEETGSHHLWRILQETCASHLHLGDLRDWGGVASAASDTSLTCLATSWRHQDVNVEEPREGQTWQNWGQHSLQRESSAIKILYLAFFVTFLGWLSDPFNG